MESPGIPGQSREAGPSSDDTQSAQSIDLTILSPNANEIPNGRIPLPNLPVSTTLTRVKERICQEVSSCPPPDRQRLIYRGKPLLDGNTTLQELFSSEVIQLEPSYAFYTQMN